MTLKEWIKNNFLNCNFLDNNLFKINKKSFLFLPDRDEIISEGWKFNLTEYEQHFAEHVDYFVFKFGNRYYYSSPEEPELNIFKYFDKAVLDDNPSFPFLGIHGKFEICNGSRDYSDWIEKAIFWSIETLGICEKDTLAGVVAFQTACLENNIKPLIGETVTVKNIKDQYEVKLYCINETGWQNLLRINAAINVFNDGFIKQDELLQRNEGLVCVIGSDTYLKENFLKNFQKSFQDRLFFQFDYSSFLNNERDKERLLSLKNWLDKFKDKVSHVFIFDAYYLDQEDYEIKKILNQIGDVLGTYQSSDQYFKVTQDIKTSLPVIAGNHFDFLFKEGIKNTQKIADLCDFQINTSAKHFSEYTMTIDESSVYSSNEDLFWGLIKEGWNKKLKNIDEQEYLARIKEEADVIKRGGFIDYLLSLSDILRWCDTQGILRAPGRGSSGGSLVCYLLDITKVDPIKYGLLFSRFLNEGRLDKADIDIDSDVQSNRRDEVKQYIAQRYGENYTCLIGTFTNLKIKSAFTDIGSIKGVGFQKLKYYTKFYSDRDHKTYTDFFKVIHNKPQFKDFIQKNYKIAELIPLCLGQPKTDSIHAAGVVIFPKLKNGKKIEIYDWLPVRKVDDKIVSEWDKDDLSKCGFLKLDMLGLAQLDKFSDIISLVKEHYGEDIDIHQIPTENDESVNVAFDYFKKGLCEDVFQFGTTGLKSFCAQFKPENINDLAVINAMYRPGTLSYGGHREYLAIKEGKKNPEYDWGLENVTKETLGQYIFQETIIQAVTELGGFTLSEADEVRRAMGKKKAEVLEPYKEQFVTGAVEKGCPQDQAVAVWDKIEGFSRYVFNKSHSVEYSILGYYSQWLKVKYPVCFWATSLRYAKDHEVARRVEEIHKTGSIKLLAVDINESEFDLHIDPDKKIIWWPFIRIKGMGLAKINAILDARKDGKFFSFNEFIHRVDGSKVNKSNVAKLIVSGAFDEIEEIKFPEQRLKLIEQYSKLRNLDLPDEYKDKDNIYNPHWWQLQQKIISGYGFVEYESMIESYWPDMVHYYIGDIINTDFIEKNVIVGGIIVSMKQGVTKRGYTYMNVVLDCNTSIMEVKLWSDFYSVNQDKIRSQEGKIMLILGTLKQYGNQYTIWTNRESKFLII